MAGLARMMAEEIRIRIRKRKWRAQIRWNICAKGNVCQVSCDPIKGQGYLDGVFSSGHGGFLLTRPPGVIENIVDKPGSGSGGVLSSGPEEGLMVKFKGVDSSPMEGIDMGPSPITYKAQKWKKMTISSQK
ncbi:hypothetical protein ACOSP7_009707 [Xanthoceras sorbifolium]